MTSLLHFVLAEMFDVERLPPVCQDLLFLLPLCLLLRSLLPVLLDGRINTRGCVERMKENIKEAVKAQTLILFLIKFKCKHTNRISSSSSSVAHPRTNKMYFPTQTLETALKNMELQDFCYCGYLNLPTLLCLCSCRQISGVLSCVCECVCDDWPSAGRRRTAESCSSEPSSSWRPRLASSALPPAPSAPFLPAAQMVRDGQRRNMSHLSRPVFSAAQLHV